MADLVRRPVDDLHTVRQQKFERRHAVVGEGADDLAVVVAVGWKAVGFDHRPVGQILEEQVRQIFDAVLLLVAGAAAERQVAAGGDGMAANMVLGLDDDHRRAGLARHDRGGQAGRAGADDDDVGLAIPIHCICHFGLFRLDCGRDTNSIADFVSLGMIAPRSRIASWRISLPPTGSPTRRARSDRGRRRESE